MIDVQSVGDHFYRVVVDEFRQTTHTVELSPDYYNELTGGSITEKTLIRASFEYLLDHEPNTSIKKEFSLPTISDYFPGFEGAMRDVAHH